MIQAKVSGSPRIIREGEGLKSSSEPKGRLVSHSKQEKVTHQVLGQSSIFTWQEKMTEQQISDQLTDQLSLGQQFQTFGR